MCDMARRSEPRKPPALYSMYRAYIRLKRRAALDSICSTDLRLPTPSPI